VFVKLLVAFGPAGLFVLDYTNKEFEKYKKEDMLDILIRYPKGDYGLYIWEGELGSIEEGERSFWYANGEYKLTKKMYLEKGLDHLEYTEDNKVKCSLCEKKAIYFYEPRTESFLKEKFFCQVHIEATEEFSFSEDGWDKGEWE
jgi:hypothetical protein